MTIFSHAARADVPIVVIDDERLRDDGTLKELYREILDHVEASGKKHLLLDLELVREITSAGLNMLIRVRKKCEKKGTSLHLCHLHPAVDEVFKKTKLRKLFHVHENVDVGVKSIEAAALAHRLPK